MNELPFDLKALAFQAAVQAAERVAQSSITIPTRRRMTSTILSRRRIPVCS